MKTIRISEPGKIEVVQTEMPVRQKGEALLKVLYGGITWLFNDEFYPYPSAVNAICKAADEVGFDKLMWGSDYPRTMTTITYRMSLDFIEKSKQISENDKRAFLGENAQKFYGFGKLNVPQKIKNMAEN